MKSATRLSVNSKLKVLSFFDCFEQALAAVKAKPFRDHVWAYAILGNNVFRDILAKLWVFLRQIVRRVINRLFIWLFAFTLFKLEAGINKADLLKSLEDRNRAVSFCIEAIFRKDAVKLLHALQARFIVVNLVHIVRAIDGRPAKLLFDKLKHVAVIKSLVAAEHIAVEVALFGDGLHHRVVGIPILLAGRRFLLSKHPARAICFRGLRPLLIDETLDAIAAHAFQVAANVLDAAFACDKLQQAPYLWRLHSPWIAQVFNVLDNVPMARQDRLETYPSRWLLVKTTGSFCDILQGKTNVIALHPIQGRINRFLDLFGIDLLSQRRVFVLVGHRLALTVFGQMLFILAFFRNLDRVGKVLRNAILKTFHVELFDDLHDRGVATKSCLDFIL